jgi:hypothetical protein
VRHRHAAIHPTTRLARGHTRAPGSRNSTLRGRRHPLMGLARQNARSAPHRIGSPPRTICSGTACTIWMGPGGDTACTSTGLHTWGNASCAAMQMGIGVGSASCAGLVLLCSAHRLNGRRHHSSRRGLRRGSRSLRPGTSLSSNGWTSCSAHR